MELVARGLSTTVVTTLGLLGLGAFLVVLGIFDQALDWDIFSPRLEKVLWGIFGSSVALAALGLADRRLEAERSREFKGWVRLQVEPLAPQIAREVEALRAPSHEARPQTLLELLNTLDGLLDVRSATLFLADSAEEQALWQLTARRGSWSSTNGPAFERRFVADDRARAVRQALAGDRAWIEQINGDRNFVWYEVITGEHGRPLAVLLVEGNPDSRRVD